jgi:hypothetical protein
MGQTLRHVTFGKNHCAGAGELEFREMKYFQELVSARADDIVQKWIDFFVLHKPIKPERLTGRVQ